ncbi:hypothetical protein FGG78_38240, partial [Thioclava sp. BHET1]
MLHKHLSAFALSALLPIAFAATTAQAAQPLHIRGTIESISGATLKVHTREGSSATVTLADKAVVAGVVKAQVADIKPGDYVGIASLPNKDGVAGALEVVIFPPAMKGTGEGSFGWDLEPKSTMTNATVATAVKNVDGRTLNVTYNGKDKKIAIPDGTPVVAVAPGKRTDLTTGATVFIAAVKTGTGLVGEQIV